MLEATAQCHLCKLVVPAVAIEELEVADAFPTYDGRTAPNARLFRSLGHALLHHVCASMQANARRDEPYFDIDRGWWACQKPNRPLDANAYFDIDCLDCAMRWAAAQTPD
jgi:hypothetical protein